MKEYTVLVDSIEVHTRRYFVMSHNAEEAETQIKEDAEGIDGLLKEGLPYDDQYQGLYEPRDGSVGPDSFTIVEVEEVRSAPNA